MKICVIGTGYVGLVTAVGLAELGHLVWGVDRTAEKVGKLSRGQTFFFEPGLEKLLNKTLKSGRIFFTLDLAKAINRSDVVFICVGTPPKNDGSADLTDFLKVVGQLAKNARKKLIVVDKSTVPVGTGARVQAIFNRGRYKHGVASCPEFLREGKAIYDFFHSDRIVVGSKDGQVAAKVLSVFAKLPGIKLKTKLETAEMIKYASNAFLATKISFINEIANLCEKVGADVKEVAKGMGLDKRINPYFLNAGIGYGGSCFPKDVKALKQIAGGKGYDFKLLKSVIEVNNQQKKLALKKAKEFLGELRGKNIAVLGLAFKDNTDDVRESAAVVLVDRLNDAGARISAYDPQAMSNAAKALKSKINFCRDAYEASVKADLVIVATEWPVFKNLNWARIKKSMKSPKLLDGKNLLDRQAMEKIGFKYQGIGQ